MLPPARPERTGPRLNERIRVPRVFLIDEQGVKIGEIGTDEALVLARDRGLDLIEVQPTARPPVCKLGDYGKMKYEEKKRAHENKKKQVVIDVKEIVLRPKTDEHDLDVKRRAARRFIEDGDKVKITVRFKGRELAHKDIGLDQCNAFATSLNEVAVVESPPRIEGKQIFMLLAPKKK